MSEFDEIRRRWDRDRAAFEMFGKYLGDQIETATQGAGIRATVSWRAKDIDSLIKKLIRKPTYQYETLGDKAGVRVIVRHIQEIAGVIAIAEKLFSCGTPEDTAERLAEDRVGYLSTHIDVRLWERDEMFGTYPGQQYHAELQVRTLAQHLWSEMSHDTTYKSGTLVDLDLQRRVNLLAGLIEVADREFSRLEEEFSRLTSIAEVKLLKALEKQFYKLTPAKSDTDLSLDVIRTLWPLYAKPPEEIEIRLDQILSEKSEILRAIFHEAAQSSRGRRAFLFQPEALMIYDLLHISQYDLRRAWAAHFPERELERLANDFGVSFD